jgi:hypothetical protein
MIAVGVDPEWWCTGHQRMDSTGPPD